MQLWQKTVGPVDGSGYKSREERNVQKEVQKISFRFFPAHIYINQVTNSLKCEIAYPHRYYKTGNNRCIPRDVQELKKWSNGKGYVAKQYQLGQIKDQSDGKQKFLLL